METPPWSGGAIREGFPEEVTWVLKYETETVLTTGSFFALPHPTEGPGQRSRLASMLDSDTEGEGDVGSTINPSVAMAIAGGPLAPGSRTSISQGPVTVSIRLPRHTIQLDNRSYLIRYHLTTCHLNMEKMNTNSLF